MFRILCSLVIVCSFALGGCATNPVTGATDIVLMSEAEEIRMGRKMHEELMAKKAAYEDKKVQTYVNRIGQTLAAASPRSELNYTFTVIDSQRINAFAAPGGYVYINRGLLNYLDSEAELAAVLAHEIGHITARHTVRQRTSAMASNIASQLLYVFTGSAGVAQAGNQLGTMWVRGYGRKHELQADSEGAIYMHNADYNPEAMLQVLGVLKDQDQYQKAKAAAAGKKSAGSYHGVFSTHPRNDQRLQEVVRAAGKLEARVYAQPDPARFRAVMEGLAYGKSSTSAQRQEERFYHNRLGFTFSHPGEWEVESKRTAIVAHNPDQSATLTLTMQRPDSARDARALLGEKLAAPKLFQSAPLSQAGLQGHTGVSPAAARDNRRRLAVIYYGGVAYLLAGEVTADADFDSQDPSFLQIIESFRPMQRGEYEGKKQQRITWRQAGQNTTFAGLARGVRIPDAENQLRLMNGYYPSGEPAAGEWIKIVK